MNEPKMKVLRESKPKPDGTVNITVNVPVGTQIAAFRPDTETVFAVDENSHYRLHESHGDVVAGHIIAEAVEVYWCSASQKWLEA